MTSLVEFLTARMDEDEAAARAATEGPWAAHGASVDGARHQPVVMSGWDSTYSDAAHIARHDPARVLREVAAKRRIVEEAFQYEAKIDGEWGCCHGADEIRAGKCPDLPADGVEIIRALASVYSDHPDYREEWA